MGVCYHLGEASPFFFSSHTVIILFGNDGTVPRQEMGRGEAQGGTI